MALLTMAAPAVMVSRAVLHMVAVTVHKTAATAITAIPAHLPAAPRDSPGKAATAVTQAWAQAMAVLTTVAIASKVVTASKVVLQMAVMVRRAAIMAIPVLLRVVRKASRGKVATAAVRV